jgi:hypothetical protein
MNRTTTAMLTLTMLLSAASAGATPARSPFWSTEEARETELSLSNWDTPEVVERKRSFGRKYAVFHAEPQEIEEAAVLVFEVESEGQVRWRCVAVDDVAECLGAPVRIRYQKQDEVVRLKVKAMPRHTPRGKQLVREAKKDRNLRLFADGRVE